MSYSSEVSPPVNFSSVLKEKYLESTNVESFVGIYFPTVGGGHREIEYARSEKLNRQLKCSENRTEIDLRNCRIEVIDLSPDIAKRFCNVRVIDLSLNLISTWSDLAVLFDAFPALEPLIVTGNPLNMPGESELGLVSKNFSKLRMITMGKLNYDWNSVLRCSNVFLPQIEYLDLFSNNITSIFNVKSGSFSCLNTLVLSENAIVDWSSINELASLERLETLQLVDCALRSISFPSYLNKPFPCLRHLNVKNNHLKAWRDVAQLNKLPHLQELIIKGNPVFEEINHDYAFNFVLSIIGNLLNLNRQQISPSSRKEGEIHYLRFFYSNYVKARAANDDTFFKENPRYLHLIEKYGEPEDLSRATVKESSMVSVELLDSVSQKRLVKRLPKRITIQALKILIKRLFQMDDLTVVELSCLGQGEHGQPHKIVLDKDDYSLSHFSVQEGDTLYVKPQV